MLTQDAGEKPPGGMELPPANTAPGASIWTSALVGFGAITICAARSVLVILVTRSAALAWHSALGQVTFGTTKAGADPSVAPPPEPPEASRGPGPLPAAASVTGPPSEAPPVVPPDPVAPPPAPLTSFPAAPVVVPTVVLAGEPLVEPVPTPVAAPPAPVAVSDP